VGSLPPGESASIRLEYVTELAVQADDGLRFCLPAVLNPRYQPQGRKTTELNSLFTKHVHTKRCNVQHPNLIWMEVRLSVVFVATSFTKVSQTKQAVIVCPVVCR